MTKLGRKSGGNKKKRKKKEMGWSCTSVCTSHICFSDLGSINREIKNIIKINFAKQIETMCLFSNSFKQL